MFNKRVFVVREYRCGGSFLSSYIGNKITERWNVLLHDGVFHDTHDFTELNDIVHDPNIFVIRIARRNLTEHFLSIQATESIKWGFTNLTPEIPSHPLWDRIRDSKIEIKPTEVQQYVEKKIVQECAYILKMLAHNVPNTTIWYEDAFAGPFDIPELDLQGLDPANEKDAIATFKLPDYKQTVFTNYDNIPQWIERYKNAYIKKHNLEKLLEHWTSNTSC